MLRLPSLHWRKFYIKRHNSVNNVPQNNSSFWHTEVFIWSFSREPEVQNNSYSVTPEGFDIKESKVW